MSSTTPTIGLKKPEGSDPFLTEDFASNYDKIDAAFAARPAGGGSGGGNADTLGGSPKSFFYGPHNPPPATGTSSHSHTEYAPIAHTHAEGGSGITQAEADARYAPISHGTHGGGGEAYTLPADVVKSPGRVNPSVIMSVTGYAFNNQNGVVITPGFGGSSRFTSPPTVVVTPHQGSNIDMVPNIQGRTTTEFSCRIAQVKGIQVTTTGSLCWVAIGP